MLRTAQWQILIDFCVTMLFEAVLLQFAALKENRTDVEGYLSVPYLASLGLKRNTQLVRGVSGVRAGMKERQRKHGYQVPRNI